MITCRTGVSVAPILLPFFSPPTGHVVCGILVPKPGIELGPSAVRARSPNRWTAQGIPSPYTSDAGACIYNVSVHDYGMELSSV